MYPVLKESIHRCGGYECNNDTSDYINRMVNTDIDAGNSYDTRDNPEYGSEFPVPVAADCGDRRYEKCMIRRKPVIGCMRNEGRKVTDDKRSRIKIQSSRQQTHNVCERKRSECEYHHSFFRMHRLLKKIPADYEN